MFMRPSFETAAVGKAYRQEQLMPYWHNYVFVMS